MNKTHIDWTAATAKKKHPNTYENEKPNKTQNIRSQL